GTAVALAARRRNATTLVPASVLENVIRTASGMALPAAVNDTVYWSWPVRPFPAGAMSTGAAREDGAIEPFKVTQGGFTVFLMTPQVVAWRVAASGIAAADTSNPFAIAASPKPPDPIAAWAPWKTFHDERRAVVVLDVSPERASYPRVPDRMLEAKDADFYSLVLRRDGVPLHPLQSQRVRAVVRIEEYTRRRRPVPNAGVYVFHPGDFTTPGGQYSLEIVDASQRRVTLTLPPAMLQAVAADLRPWQR
ncbi:MAG TPA: hypothetical protein VFX50_00400, partial [Gemmatimonadales bacterium]|nr:hypothetical protein [Gemmatimonadales bacterium]